MSLPANINQDHYDPEEAAGTPLQRAVQALAQQRGMLEAEFSTWTMGEILKEAETVYGDQLPDFWRVWKDWSGDPPSAPMGDL